MRIWTLHPKYLDARGLTALWREGLLAQSVLRGKTGGYRRHPQLIRFQNLPSPLGAIGAYLRAVQTEGESRGYRFDKRRITRAAHQGSIPVRQGQLEFEWGHLMNKLAARDPERMKRIEQVRRVQAHPLFRIIPGEMEVWEKGAHPMRRQGSAPRRSPQVV